MAALLDIALGPSCGARFIERLNCRKGDVGCILIEGDHFCQVVHISIVAVCCQVVSTIYIPTAAESQAGSTARLE